MITFEEMQTMLAEISHEIPKDFYKELNGNIVLLDEVKHHAESAAHAPLYIMGEYHNDRQGYGGLGRCIKIYYGSFMQVYSHYPPERFKEELRKTLIHEFTHHLESLAGERGLEIEDAVQLEKYRAMTRKE